MHPSSTSSRTPRIPAPSAGSEQSPRLSPPRRPAPPRDNLIDVRYVRGGQWRAICECGEHSQLFGEHRSAWTWITDHQCPVLEGAGTVDDGRSRG